MPQIEPTPAVLSQVPALVDAARKLVDGLTRYRANTAAGLAVLSDVIAQLRAALAIIDGDYML